MKKALVCPHPVFHVHLKQDLIDMRHLIHITAAGSHKMEEIRIRKRIIFRFLDDSVLVESGHGLDGFRHKAIGFGHH